MVPFGYEDSGRIAGVEIGGSALRQPQKPIPADVTRLTGITSDMVAGKTIDFVADAQFAGDSLIVAHNAGFDRRFVERFRSEERRVVQACVTICRSPCSTYLLKINNFKIILHS